ncbi:PAS domain-containing sensor histidine kinase [Microvirga sp. STR05]|uniref:histidine kinase n=1 Tax=Hymenobacter duratus TaxID=2771356 RepID=A0ABR8JE78_9BACT|nr:PAS domain-containing sensor histidine kinase [Hymenobacter duratus]MBD2715163.1 PAS domain-containing sensor histidine kinase [Hymenobacter duratus]MBR7950070.1 PAS domain-containing sensor histidine kinase [Microvirga sp. STR05]
MIDAGTPLDSTGFEHSAEAAFRLDEKGRLSQLTAGFAGLLQQPAAHLAGQLLMELTVSSEADALRQYLRRAAAGEVVACEAQLLVQGQPLPVLLTLLPAAEGHAAGVYGVVRKELASSTNSLLLEREKHLSVIFDNIADVTFVLRREEDGQFRFMFVNKAFEQTTGVSAARVVGSLVPEVIPEPSLSMVLEHYNTALRTMKSVVWQEVSDYPNGRKTAEVSITPVLEPDGTCCQLVGIVHDLTAQKEVEADLQTSNERFQYALRATTDALYDWNVAANTLFWGEGFNTLFGYELKQNPTPFSTWADAVEEAEHQRVVAGLVQTAFNTANTFWQQEYKFLRADGSWAVVFDRGYILRDEHGHPVRMIGAMQDITARKEAEEKQLLLADRLGKQNADLQQFAYIVSHNLRAPLANALGYSNLLLRVDKASPVFDESLNHLRTSIQQLDGVLADVNGILAIRDQQGSYRPEPVALAAVCRQALTGLEKQLRQCGGQLHCSIAEQLQVQGSRAYFHSIFHNLISNAIKYRSDARPLQISIEASVAADEHVTIEVWDNGSGFDQEKEGEDVFQLYRRFHPDKPGRGIGLFLVKSHVESMNGRISVQSKVGIGTHFTLEF